MNTSTGNSSDEFGELAWEKLAKTWDTIRPPLYYATNVIIERGQIWLIKEPELLVCHPDDLDELRRQITHRRFVHLRDRPPDSVKEFLRTSAPART